jgi:hypothetical protein
MLDRLKAAAWIVAFIAVCAVWAHEVVRASHKAELAQGPWICPIAGQCGPAGTPGLGRW